MVTDSSLAALRPWQSFSEKILYIVEAYYRLFGKEPILSRILLSEVLQHTPGLHLAEYIGTRDHFILGMQELVAGAQATGEIGSSESAELIARHIFFSYSAALRWWLASSEHPQWRAGVREFAAILKLQSLGLGLKAKAEKGSQDSPVYAPGSRNKFSRR